MSVYTGAGLSILSGEMGSDTELGDLALVEAWRAGDARAGQALFERHYACVARFFRNKVDSEPADLIQTTFLNCLEAIDRFRGAASFKTYLLAIARNVLLLHYRRKRRHDSKLDPGVTSVQDLGPTPTALLERREDDRLLLLGLRSLPIDAQTLLELYFWESLSGPEIAQVLEIPEGTVRTRIRRARQQLAEAIAKAAPGDDAQRSIADLDAWAARVRQAL